jgi:uncharacterized protein (TIGR03067 family)
LIWPRLGDGFIVSTPARRGQAAAIARGPSPGATAPFLHPRRAEGRRPRESPRSTGGATMIFFDVMIGLGLMILAGSAAMVQETGSKPAGSDKACTPEDLVGRYVIVSGEKDGMKEPEERIKGTIVTFSKETVVVEDKDKKELYSASYKLDSKKNPSDIIMTSKVQESAGEIARGLIKKEGDTLHLIYALPTGEIPAGFKTREKQLMFVMKPKKDE